jgi:hypothetical protein
VPHPGKIYDEAAVAQGTSGPIVPTAAYRQRQIMRASNLNRGLNLFHVLAQCEQGGLMIDRAVPDLPDFVVGLFTGNYDAFLVHYRPKVARNGGKIEYTTRVHLCS